MSKRTWMGAATLLLLAGCGPSHYVIDNEASSSGEVHTVQGSDGVMMGAVAFNRPATDVNDAQRQRCLQSTLEPQPVQVERGELMTPVQKSDLSFNTTVTDDRSERSALTGATSWQGRDIAYRLELQTLAEGNYYYFDQLGERGVAAEGQAPRFEPIGAWSEAAPMQVHQGLEALTERLQSCLAGAAAGSAAASSAGS